MSDFDQFWTAYPRKVGKFAAQKAYDAVRKRGVTQAELLAGVEQYIAHKPAYQDWCHATTWLNQGRWMDDYTPVKPPQPVHVPTGAWEWLYECERLHGGSCNQSKSRHDAKMQGHARVS